MRIRNFVGMFHTRAPMIASCPKRQFRPDGKVFDGSAERSPVLSKVSNFQPFDGYTDKSASEKKLVRNAFKEGDCYRMLLLS